MALFNFYFSDRIVRSRKRFKNTKELNKVINKTERSRKTKIMPLNNVFKTQISVSNSINHSLLNLTVLISAAGMRCLLLAHLTLSASLC